MITQLAHVCLNVANLDRTLDFYHGVLELPIKFKFMRNGRVIGAYLDVGRGNYIEVFEKPDVAVANTGIVHFCLETGDIDLAVQALAAKGIACTEQKLGADQSYQSWIQDPDGNRIELHQYTADSAQLKGGTVEV